MTLGGWIVMLISVGTISSLFAYCIYQVLTEKQPEEHHHHGFESKTPDTQD